MLCRHEWIIITGNTVGVVNHVAINSIPTILYLDLEHNIMGAWCSGGEADVDAGNNV
jgi:hypothetical protein